MYELKCQKLERLKCITAPVPVTVGSKSNTLSVIHENGGVDDDGGENVTIDTVGHEGRDEMSLSEGDASDDGDEEDDDATDEDDEEDDGVTDDEEEEEDD